MIYNSNLHMFPELCVKYLKEKFHLGELNIRELMYVMKRIGIKTFKVHTNGGVYDVFLRRDVNGVQDFEFINILVLHRKEKHIKDEWSKEPITDYTPEMSNMKNASDDLLKNDDIYFENENRIFMKQDKKKLYENIMASVAKEVKKALNENKEDYSIAKNIYDMVTKADSGNSMYLDVALRQGFGWSTRTLFSKNIIGQNRDSAEILNFSNECFDGDVISDSNAAIIKKLTEMEEDESCKGYIVFEEEPYVRGKLVPVYKFVVKLTEVGANLANDITNKRKTREDSKYDNTDLLEKKLTDLNVSGRMSNFLSKKYGISKFAVEDIKFMCKDFAYMLLSYVERDNMDYGDFEDDDWDVTKYPKHKGYGPMGGFGPMGFGRRGHVDNKKVRDISKRIETTVFEILEDIKKNDK